jgi:hypothetical protein
MLILLYWALIPLYCENITDCRLDSNKTSTPYNWFLGGLLLVMVSSAALTAFQCPSTSKTTNILYAIFSTIACWSIFAFIVYGREYFRMSFANVFGYMWISKKANDILNKISPSNNIDADELIKLLSSNSDSSSVTKYPIGKDSDVEFLKKKLTKHSVDDNFELMTYIRSGINYVPSLKYIKDYTNKFFVKNISDSIDGGQDEVRKNEDLIELLNIVYTRDMIGEIILFAMAGIMCSYLSEYLIKKINCNYKTNEEIDKGLNDYDKEYNKTKQMKQKEFVVRM